MPFFNFLYSKACEEPSVSSTFVMLSSNLDDIKGEECRPSFGRVRCVGKYKGRSVFKVKEGGKYKEVG